MGLFETLKDAALRAEYERLKLLDKAEQQNEDIAMQIAKFNRGGKDVRPQDLEFTRQQLRFSEDMGGATQGITRTAKELGKSADIALKHWISEPDPRPYMGREGIFRQAREQMQHILDTYAPNKFNPWEYPSENRILPRKEEEAIVKGALGENYKATNSGMREKLAKSLKEAMFNKFKTSRSLSKAVEPRQKVRDLEIDPVTGLTTIKTRPISQFDVAEVFPENPNIPEYIRADVKGFAKNFEEDPFYSISRAFDAEAGVLSLQKKLANPKLPASKRKQYEKTLEKLKVEEIRLLEGEKAAKAALREMQKKKFTVID